MVERRIENGHFLYKYDYYPCREYMLISSGPNDRGESTFTATEVWDKKPPYNCKDWKPIENAIAPRGYVWYSNGKSRFSKEYRHALVRKEST